MDPVTGINLAAQAVKLAEQGFRVFPCHAPHPVTTCTCAKAACTSPGKHPRTARGHLDATDDVAKVKKLFKREANIGIATGKGILVVDVDLGRKGGDNGIDWPDTYTVLTGNGFHLYYMVTGAYPCRVDLWPGIDIRCDGGYVIGPGSIHPSGRE